MDETEERLRKLEAFQRHARETNDRLDESLAMLEIWLNHIIMPSILLLASHGLRKELASMLSLARKEAENLGYLPRRLDYQKVMEHWQKAVEAIGPAPRYAPPDWG